MSRIYNMKLHQCIDFIDIKGRDVNIIRVAGGWIYIYEISEKILSSVFVPFNNEYMEIKYNLNK